MSAGDRDTLAAVIAEHDALRSHGPGTGWFCRGCGQKMTEWPTPEQCRPHESAMEVVHRAHLADVLLASDWLREQRADVCDQIIERIRGMEFLGASSLALGGQVAQQEILVLIEQHKRLVPYRTTEDTGSSQNG